MNTPYQILDLNDEAGDEEIRHAYLDMVKRYPPERFPDEFQRIYRAYELIRTEEDRLAYRLFYCKLPDAAEIAALLLPVEEAGISGSVEEFQQRLGRDLEQFCLTFHQ